MRNERINFYMTVDARLEQKIVREAEKRDMKPADLAEKILEFVFRDNLVAGVLDDE